MVTNQLVVFNLGEEEYGIDISCTKEIIRIPKLTRIPNVPDFVEGVFDLRGTVITVIDLKKRFELSHTEKGADNRLLVLEFDDTKIGIIVDDISEVMRTDHLTVHSLESELTGISKNSIEGVLVVGQRLILLLNILKLKTDIFDIIQKRR